MRTQRRPHSDSYDGQISCVPTMAPARFGARHAQRARCPIARHMNQRGPVISVSHPRYPWLHAGADACTAGAGTVVQNASRYALRRRTHFRIAKPAHVKTKQRTYDSRMQCRSSRPGPRSLRGVGRRSRAIPARPPLERDPAGRPEACYRGVVDDNFSRSTRSSHDQDRPVQGQHAPEHTRSILASFRDVGDSAAHTPACPSSDHPQRDDRRRRSANPARSHARPGREEDLRIELTKRHCGAMAESRDRR